MRRCAASPPPRLCWASKLIKRIRKKRYRNHRNEFRNEFRSDKKSFENLSKIDKKLMETGGICLPEGGPGASWTTLGTKMAPGPQNDPTFGGPGHHFRGQRGPNGAQAAPKM